MAARQDVETDSSMRAARRPRRWRRWAAVILSVAVILYGVAAYWVYGNQEAIIFPGAARPTTRSTPPDAQEVWITSEDGCRVPAWYRVGEGRTRMSPGPAVIYFHGNGDLLETSWWVADHYPPAGISALVVEYRGYGQAEGAPSQAALVADAIRFHEWLTARPEVDPQRVVYHGMSLGGAVATALAAQREPAAMILESTFASLVAMAHRYLLPGFLCRHPFRSDQIIAQLGVPIAIFHGRHDHMIPFSHGQRLHRLASNSRFTPLDCGHNDFHNDWENIRSFLDEVGLLPTGTQGG